MQKIILALMIIFFGHLSYSQNNKHKNSVAKKPVSIHFTADFSPVISKFNKATVIGVRGSVPPLSWNKTFRLIDPDGDGKYEGTVKITSQPGTRISYKYIYGENWENNPNRVVVTGKENQMTVNDQWEKVLRENSSAYHDSIEAKMLQDTIAVLDSLLFDSYNRCLLDVHATFFSEDIEFYHDRGGLSTSKSQLMEAVKNNICNKVRRELKPGSLEVSPIPGYGAVCIGLHRFHNLVEKTISGYSKFVTVWQLKDGNWKVTRVISLH